MTDLLAGPSGSVSRALLGVLDAEPALAEAYRRGPLARWDAAFRLAFGRAAERGEIREGLEDSLAAASGPAILIQAWLVLGQDIEGDLAAQVVDEVMMPLLTRPAAAPPPRPAP